MAIHGLQQKATCNQNNRPDDGLNMTGKTYLARNNRGYDFSNGLYIKTK